MASWFWVWFCAENYSGRLAGNPGWWPKNGGAPGLPGVESGPHENTGRICNQCAITGSVLNPYQDLHTASFE
jgi:hypothetical protein